jgi:hypothetical protein
MPEAATVEGRQQDDREARNRDRRDYERYLLNSAHGNLVHNGSRGRCEFVDISLSGCCIRTEKPFLAGALAPIEVVLPIFGVILRMNGVTQWVRQGHLIGVRFVHPSSRAKNQLAGLLTCLVDESATEIVIAAVASEPPAEKDAPVVPPPIHEAKKLTLVPSAKPPKAHKPPPPPLARPTYGSAHWVRSPLDSDWPAVLRILKDNSHLSGILFGLGMEGCGIQTLEPYTLGIHTRVEVCFQMRGLPFQLAGVVQTIFDAHCVGVEFSPLSNRKREELTQLIDEIRASSEALPN